MGIGIVRLGVGSTLGGGTLLLGVGTGSGDDGLECTCGVGAIDGVIGFHNVWGKGGFAVTRCKMLAIMCIASIVSSLN